MCRNIKILHNFEPPVTDTEIRAAALQFVRKITGFKTPARVNEKAFFAAVDEVARISATLLTSLESTTLPKNRQQEAAKQRRVLSEDSAVKCRVKIGDNSRDLSIENAHIGFRTSSAYSSSANSAGEQ